MHDESVILVKTTNISALVTKTECDAKVKKIKDKIPDHDRYVASNNFNKFSGAAFYYRWEQAKLTANNNLGIADQRSIKNEENIQKLRTFNFR